MSFLQRIFLFTSSRIWFIYKFIYLHKTTASTHPGLLQKHPLIPFLRIYNNLSRISYQNSVPCVTLHSHRVPLFFHIPFSTHRLQQPAVHRVSCKKLRNTSGPFRRFINKILRRSVRTFFITSSMANSYATHGVAMALHHQRWKRLGGVTDGRPMGSEGLLPAGAVKCIIFRHLLITCLGLPRCAIKKGRCQPGRQPNREPKLQIQREEGRAAGPSLPAERAF